jgi:hypothetical protein
MVEQKSYSLLAMICLPPLSIEIKKPNAAVPPATAPFLGYRPMTKGGLILPVSLAIRPQPSSTVEPIPGFLLARKEPSINNPHLTPIIITGGAALAAIIALSRAKDSKADPLTANSPATKWTNETLTSSFVAAIPEITPEINLELATATQTEVFTKASSWILWGLFDLGTSTVQIRVPVTYRYHLRLREP